jgi:hypothetical protein
MGGESSHTTGPTLTHLEGALSEQRTRPTSCQPSI